MADTAARGGASRGGFGSRGDRGGDRGRGRGRRPRRGASKNEEKEWQVRIFPVSRHLNDNADAKALAGDEAGTPSESWKD